VAAAVVVSFAVVSFAVGFVVVNVAVVSFVVAVGNFVDGFAGENFVVEPLASHYSRFANSAVEAVVLQRSPHD
jgi:hypothetical protein